MSSDDAWSPPTHSAENLTWVVGHAILAPSSHNTQPWIVEPRGATGFDLYVDRDRLLPEVDPHARQAHISHGCFLEAAHLAARARSLEVEIARFPKGEYGRQSVEPMPVARLHFEEGGAAPTATESRLFEALPRRRTNKRPFDADREIPNRDAERLEEIVAGGGLTLRYVDAPNKRSRLADLCAEAMEIEVSSEARNRELAEWFRFHKSDLEEKRDGFGLEQSGTTGLVRWFVETFVLDEDEAPDPEGDFARQGAEMCRKQAETAAAFIALVTDENRRRDQLDVGRAYMKLQLMATSLGIATHPLSQATQEYEEMTPLRSRLVDELGVAPAQTVQMLVRAGCAADVPHAPRRPIEDFYSGE